ncbi:MAG: DUF2849 domain-containing protein [Nitratireductor sp.]
MKTITANRLDDGAVVWLSGAGWETSIAQAAVLSAPDAIDAGLQAAARAVANREVVEIAAIDVTLDQNRRPVPVRLRERIRAFGPTIPFASDAQQSLVA